MTTVVEDSDRITEGERAFEGTRAVLFRKGIKVAELVGANITFRRADQLLTLVARLKGAPSFYLKPGVSVVCCYMVDRRYLNSAWLEADVKIESFDKATGIVRASGHGWVRPSTKPDFIVLKPKTTR